MALILLFLFVMPCFADEDVNVQPLKRSIENTVVNVGATATALPATSLADRYSMIVQNLGSVVVYIGDANVTANEASTGGYQLQKDGDSIAIDISDDIVLYGIIASGTSPCSVLEVR